MKKLFLLVILLFLMKLNVYSAVKNVPSEYATIQTAIIAAGNADTILVAPGTYFENINFRGKNIVVTSSYYLTNDPAAITGTVINGSTPLSPDTGSCVIFSSHEDSTAVLQGFSITGGSGTIWEDEHGAGLFREGGGILVQSSSPVIKNNFIFNNSISNISGVTSAGGGGVRISNGYVRFYNNIVVNNSAYYGSGVVLNFTGAEIKNNIISSNYGSIHFGSGSGIWINGTFEREIMIINNTICRNTATAGICGVYGSGNSVFKNNIIWGNTSPTNIQVSVSLNMTNSNIQGGYPGFGNINIDPLFADSSYILSNGSPCVDNGDPNSIYDDFTNPDHGTLAMYPSQGGIRNDIGAYGGPLAGLMNYYKIGIPIQNPVK